MLNQTLSSNGEARFTASYNRLNEAQRQAVDAIEGPVMVIAGPGTGKTQILALRIANILLKTDTAPDNILALTFTNAGARAMRERVLSFIGATAYRVPIFTFHSFAEHLIARYPEAYPKILGGLPATDLERVSYLETILTNPVFSVLRPGGRPDYYLSDIKTAISDLKKEAVNPDDFARHVSGQVTALAAIPQWHEKGAHKGKERGEYREAKKMLAKNQELLLVYRQYEALLITERRYDYDDMILETLRALKQDEDFRLSLQETYQYVLADEHQDVNGSQNQILTNLTSFHDQPNLFVVGDEKQAIYRFQGASLENFLAFTTQYPKATVIALTKNYRSSQAILDVAEERIQSSDSALATRRVPLAATTNQPAIIEHTTFGHTAQEDDYVVKTVKEAIIRGVPPAEISVMVRKNHQVEHYAALLEAAGLSVAASADANVLETPLAQSVLTLLTSIAHPENETALFALLHEPYWEILPAELWQALTRRNYTTPLSAIVADTPALAKIESTLRGARERQLTEAPQHVLAFALEESGLRSLVLRQDPIRGSAILRRLYDEVEALVVRTPGVTLAQLDYTFTLLKDHHLPLTAAAVPEGTSSVSVMTAHKAKGLEYTVVIMPDLTDQAWSGRLRPTVFFLPDGTGRPAPSVADATDDEVRLFYVALTRAKRALYFSHATSGPDGRERGVARVLGELTSPLIVRNTPAPTLGESVLTGVEPRPAVRLDTEVVQQALREYGLSATALNNYLRSPWNYIYRNTLRIPEPKAVHQLFGTVMHGVIDWVVAKTTQGTRPTTSAIKHELERQLGHLPLSTEEYTRLHARALSALVVYVPHLVGTVKEPVQTEAKFTALLPTGLPDFPQVLLTGMLDRLDFNEVGQVRVVVDYKTTRKPLTRGQIEGTTTDSTGDYKRQLVFYALLLSLQSDERFHCRNMTLSFVEPMAHGVIKEEHFTITDEETRELEAIIRKTVEALWTGKALATPCDRNKSDYCHLVALLREG